MRQIALAAVTIALLTAGCGSSGGDDGASTDPAAAGTGTVAADDTATESDDTATESQDNGGSEEGGDGCDLISDEVAASVLGIDIVRREPNEDATTGGVSCLKGTERVTDLTQAYYVSVSNTPGGAAFLDQAIGEADYEPVSGVGDRAEFLASAGSLFIAAGADLVTVQVVEGGVPSSLDDCLTVAEEVLGNL